MATEVGNVIVLSVEMFDDTVSFQFPDVGEVWSPVMLSSSRNVHPSSHRRVSPLSNDERPYMCVTCASWETSPKLT